jgi:hypothetical protein
MSQNLNSAVAVIGIDIGKNSFHVCAFITATIDDALHFTEEQKKEIIASYPSHERQARVLGIPALGSGRCFPLAEDRIAIEHREIPRHWARIGGLDFGWHHSFAAVELAHDRDSDCVYVVRCYRIKETSPIIHAAALRGWGKDLRWAWPRDGARETLEAAGIPLSKQYEAQGLNMLPEAACFEDGSVSVEAGVMEMLTCMESGRFKVFKEHLDWFDEYRLFHRFDGKMSKNTTTSSRRPGMPA